MATGNKLEVQIGADVSDLKQGITEAVIALEKLRQQKSANLKVGLDVTELNKQILIAKNNLAGLQKQFSATSPAVDKMAKSTANGSNALMQFSRIAQDAPYGIIGIGNNITATVESFGHLKNATGSTGGALKALAGSLLGSGGILLGISLLTTGLTLMAQSGLSVSDVIDKITGDFDEFGDAIKKASDEAVKATAGEIFGLKSLVSAAQNKALSDKERLIAVDNLQKQYPGYFGNLSKEQIMTSDLTGTVNQLTQALINKEIASNLAKAAAPQLLALYKLNAAYKTQRKEYTESQVELRKIGREQGETSQTYKEAEATMWGYYDIMERTRGEIYKATEVNKRYQNSINAINSSASKLLIKTPKAPKASKTFDTPQVSGLQSFITPLELTPVIDTSKISTSMKGIATIISEEAIRAQEAMIQFNEDISAIISDNLTSTFANLGSVIGNAIGTGGNVLEAAGKGLLSSLGGILVELGKMAIATGVGILGIKTALKTLNPVAAIAAGVALVALGSIVSSKASGLGNSMGSGGGTSTSTGNGANNTSTTSGGGGWSGGMNGTVVFEIAGTSLIGVLNNTTQRNLRIGGRG